jgi:hypothetical protein
MITLTQEIDRLRGITQHPTVIDGDRYTCGSSCGFSLPVRCNDIKDAEWYHTLFATAVSLDLQRGGSVAGDHLKRRGVDATGWTWQMVGGYGTTTPPSGFLFGGEIFAVSPEGVRYKMAPGPLGVSRVFYAYTHGLGLNLMPIS